MILDSLPPEPGPVVEAMARAMIEACRAAKVVPAKVGSAGQWTNLARSALLAALNVSRVCEGCGGTGYQENRGGDALMGLLACPSCHGSGVAPGSPLVDLMVEAGLLEQVGVTDEFFPEPNYQGNVSHGDPVYRVSSPEEKP